MLLQASEYTPSPAVCLEVWNQSQCSEHADLGGQGAQTTSSPNYHLVREKLGKSWDSRAGLLCQAAAEGRLSPSALSLRKLDSLAKF